MRLISKAILSNSRQRGFQLRCFLGAVMMLAALAGGPGVLGAQVEMPGPIHLVHVDGVVVNTAGKPIAGAEVTLVRDDKIVYKTQTSGSGEFSFEHVSGRYMLRIARTDSSPTAREIVVGDELVTRFERKKLYVIAGPGACEDECSTVYTSKHDFDQAMKKMSRTK
jgi:hypothetical protein